MHVQQNTRLRVHLKIYLEKFKKPIAIQRKACIICNAAQCAAFDANRLSRGLCAGGGKSQSEQQR
jgi:hypothetical protein